VAKKPAAAPAPSKPASRTPPPAAPPPTTARRLLPVVAAIALVGGLAIVLLAASGVLGGPSSTPAPTAGVAALPAEVDVATAARLSAEGAVLVDVREDVEWEAGHIPSAVHIPLGELEARAGELPAGKPVVVVCRSGNRSAQGRDILLATGRTDVTSMAGGVRAWQAAGQPYEGTIALRSTQLRSA
jgi:rhodanese-related sulfurtransferase